MPILNAPAKVRIDQLLVDRGLAESRTKAQALIMAGQVKIEGKPIMKAGQTVDALSEVEVAAGLKYVSRGGLKLESVASELGVSFEGKVVLDVGSSTGGFTDFALQNGAEKVYAVDVGTGQLHQKLRNDPRVVVMEKTDIRTAELPEKADLAVVDVSFISLTKVLPFVAGHLSTIGQIVAMAKPQFEADKAVASRHRGVIKDPQTRAGILAGLEAWMAEGFEIKASVDSKVAGAEGNVERFYLLSPR